MANYSTNEFKGGLKIMMDGEPCSILENEMVKPGKGQAFNRVRIRKLISGKVLEKTFKSGESVEGADVIFSDKVISINDKVNEKKKLKDFKNFKINKNLLKKCPRAIFLHCLPRGSEVDENVFKSKKSKVWLQALNRVHVQKSILLYCLGKLR